jgi:hypothetical protein
MVEPASFLHRDLLTETPANQGHQISHGNPVAAERYKAVNAAALPRES